LVNTQNIELIIKDGEIIDRKELRPDYGRQKWNAKIGKMWNEAWSW
jgi:hypothetical protein